MRICPTCGACSEDAYDLCAFDGSLLGEAFAGPRVLAERYLLEQRVAAGAMGVVYRALHLQIGSTVAVKLMQPESEELQVGLARFHREAQILGQIKHPNAVLVMDFGVEQREPSPIPFLVTEFLRGAPLSSRLEDEPRFSLEDTARVICAVCEAVEEAHQVGVIHRDLKPSNIFLERLRDGSEVVKVLDFGIAKFVELTPEVLERLQRDHAALAASYQASLDVDLLDEVVGVRAGAGTTQAEPARREERRREDRDVDSTLTEAGFMVGTIPWMAPEQMTGERVSRQTDVYAVASLLYRLLSGRLPFEGSDDDVINAKISDERPGLAEAGVEVPAALEDLLRRCFALEPAERPESVMEIAQALRETVAARRTPTTGDVTLALGVQLGAVARALDQVRSAVIAFREAPAGGLEEVYHRARDQLLSLDAPVERGSNLLHELPADLSAEREMLQGARRELAEATEDLAAAVRPLLVHPDNEFGEYLAAIWSRAGGEIADLAGRLDARLSPDDEAEEGSPRVPAPVTDLFGVGPLAEEPALADAVADLIGSDPLASEDAFDELTTIRKSQVAGLLMKASHSPTSLAGDLLRGLWRHADRLLLSELYPDARALRLLPTLAALPLPEARPFSTLSGLFSGAPQGDTTAHASLQDALAAVEEDERRVLWRCLLAHPLFTVRQLAAQQLPLSEFWNIVVHPRVQPVLLRAVFDEVAERARPEYLKVFFLCAREALAKASSRDDLEDAFLVLQRMFTISCFHEDVVFEPLLDLDRRLRARAEQAALTEPPEAYSEELAAFTARGVVETEPPESMRDIPLPIQRKLAREGHFLQYFACHANERVAKETLPHLLRLEDIVRFLRLPTLHRGVLVELAKERRFFRKEAARLALLQNPKTPANVARIYLPLLGHEQVRLLAHNKHIGGEVRTLAYGFLEKLARKA